MHLFMVALTPHVLLLTMRFLVNIMVWICVGLLVIVMLFANGLDLCWSIGHCHVVCYLDSLHVIHLVCDPPGMCFIGFGNLISLIKKLLSQDWSIALLHTLREGNFTAN